MPPLSFSVPALTAVVPMYGSAAPRISVPPSALVKPPVFTKIGAVMFRVVCEPVVWTMISRLSVLVPLRVPPLIV